ncbi:hypothetical protein [Sphingomonas sp. BK069]|uniref:hypothetical protein n=1 Tax=Sphingomonas sp. BK069 TaxID=2586979 RepID=UPI00160EE3FA|nr:hypothetical protein [Sphingomonas sp. BK069]MBB3346014.1 hypothetical protein [Sphingomonas sp. BK069]
MAHALPTAASTFPRRFDLAASRAASAAPTALPPLTPAAYLRLCREAARRPLDLVALRIAPRPADFEAARALVQQLERPGVVARHPETLEALAEAFAFDPDVYRQLATEPPERHPRICRGCGLSDWDPRALDASAWPSDQRCARCADEAGAREVTA